MRLLRTTLSIVTFATVASIATAQPAADRFFTKRAVANDLDSLAKWIVEIHPNAFHSVPAQRFYSLLDSLKTSLKDSVSHRVAITAFQLATAAIGEGHTSYSGTTLLPQDYGNRTVRLPLRLGPWSGDGWPITVVHPSLTTIQVGDILESVNGVSTSVLRDTLLQRFGGLPTFRDIVATRDFSLQLHLLGMTAPFTVVVRRADGSHATVTCDGLTREAMNALPVANASSLPYRWEVRPDSVGFIDFREMSDPGRFKKMLDSAFTAFQAQHVTGVIIDLRQNGGGNSLLGDMLLGYLTDKPFRMAARADWKVSEPYKQYIRGRDSTFQLLRKQYLDTPNGEFLTSYGPPPRAASPNGLRFRGPVVFLISGHTFSSANMLANAVKDYQLATLLGEATGEPPNDYGETITLTLPETRGLVVTSSKRFVRANGDESDVGPIRPDIEVPPDPRNGDVQLARALEALRAQRARR